MDKAKVKDKVMTKVQVGYSIFWILFGFLAVGGSIHLANAGFNGTISPFCAGFGWVFASLWLLTRGVLPDVFRIIAAVRKKKES